MPWYAPITMNSCVSNSVFHHVCCVCDVGCFEAFLYRYINVSWCMISTDYRDINLHVTTQVYITWVLFNYTQPTFIITCHSSTPPPLPPPPPPPPPPPHTYSHTHTFVCIPRLLSLLYWVALINSSPEVILNLWPINQYYSVINQKFHIWISENQT